MQRDATPLRDAAAAIDRQLRAAGAGRTVTVVWVAAPRYPKLGAKVIGWRITDSRVGAFNALAASLLTAAVDAHDDARRALAAAAGGGDAAAALGLRLRLRTVDLFALSHAVPTWQRGDGLHYDRSGVLFTAVDALFAGICP